MHYVMVQQRLKKSNDYAQKRYAALQKNIFVNGDDSYLSILKRLPAEYSGPKWRWNVNIRKRKAADSFGMARSSGDRSGYLRVFYLIVAGILGYKTS